MSSVPSIHEGSIAAAPPTPQIGTMRGLGQPGTACSEAADSPENAAMAELTGLISSLGSLSTQAQGLPLSPPTIPGATQYQGYRPQATDYTQFADDSN